MDCIRVLIITNRQDDAKILCSTLTHSKDVYFKVECVLTLAKSFEVANEEKVDIILSDFFLPDSEGIATFEILFDLFPFIPILMICDDDQEHLAIEAVGHGSQGFVSYINFNSSLMAHTLRNIIQRKASEEAFFEQSERAKVTLESIGDSVISTDVGGNVTYLNIQAERMTGWTKLEATGQPITKILDLIDGFTREAIVNPVAHVLQHKKKLVLLKNMILIRRDGSELPIEDSTAPIFDRSGKVTGAVIVFHDITNVKVMSEKMAHLAQHDFLTGLPNRLLFNERLSQAINYAQRHSTQLAVLFLDLDKFKYINDSLGHSIGDKLLKSIAISLLNNVRKSDTVCRQGGDEFVILLFEKDHALNAAFTAEKIIQSLALYHQIDEHRLHITTSIGISVFPKNGTDSETLIKNADLAMYDAKKKGRNNFQFFKNDMNSSAVERLSIEADLRNAIERKEFILHYQPKVNLSTGAIIGAEALIRWNHPVKGMILPDTFIPIAEECGLIINLGRIVLRQACMQAQEWIEKGMQSITMAVNISALEFQHRDFYKCVNEILQDCKLEAKFLQLELTESVLMDNVESSTIILHKLKEMGVELAVDDFGTGYSSLGYLSQFPIDVLKIDQSFVREITTNSSNGAIVAAIISMGASLNQKVIAEGIETTEELVFLNLHNCDEGQGYLFGWPLTSKEFTKILLKAKSTKFIKQFN